jgi:alkanesulfonate monooxygenase SsuD/methylene tetrahydromethanopterin reductase-like flavin-dependent oxidoreductase (luciferase family)
VRRGKGEYEEEGNHAAIICFTPMGDYGHDLRFGAFVTPLSERPDEVVSLARRAEAEGLDLVTFQDHPYLPKFLDTWTLMAWVAARTERVRVAPNVVNLPLRQPAVLARAAASLDLLSGGRFELGLGAGNRWDAIEAMGGPRRSARESVDALAEAIGVIRAIWDVSAAEVRTGGEHYKLQGAEPGPEPAHRIEIWLGAYKPRMLRLTGAEADGWLPSAPYLQEGDLARGNRAIDEAAAEAGRKPREIRRLLNITPDLATPERLAPAGPRGRRQHLHPRRRRPACDGGIRSGCGARGPGERRTRARRIEHLFV